MKRLLLLLCTLPYLLNAQTKSAYTLDDLISIAQASSPSALIAKNNYRASYWSYRSYQALLLPSLHLSAGLAEFNRSTQLILDPTTEGYKYVENSSVGNYAQLFVRQNIAPTGGTLSLFSDLYRLDQFSPSSKMFYQSTPVSLTYLQPIGGYNAIKWQKRLAPKEYELSKRAYLEDMEFITLKVVQLFFEVLLQQKSYQMAVINSEQTEASYKMAEQRFELGAIGKNDLLQLQGIVLNSNITSRDSKLALDLALFRLRSFLGLGQSALFDLEMPAIQQGINLDFDKVLSLSYQNGTLQLAQELRSIEAERAIAEAKANRGIRADLTVTFGLSQNAETFGGAYKNPRDKEVTGISLSMPLMDWGMGRGRVRMAQSRADVVSAQVDQAFKDHEQNVLINVLQFNNQVYQCAVSQQADRIAQERYQICLDKFANATLSVTELNMAQKEKDDAVRRHIADLRSYWSYYYEIRRLCLFDFISGKDISAEFDRLVEQ
ncbi:MAG: TolC family protein [Prevotellaceae bacterium]|jgi:outer membrane protein TolC|nr:TolC family protein [Prevotellaceae bacterium]